MVYQDSKHVAGKQYSPELKNANDEASQGLALTHEQVLDHYMEGTVDGLIEKSKGNNIPLQDI